MNDHLSGRICKPAGTALLALAAMSLGSSAQITSNRPNILLILTDDQGYADLGVQGVDDDVRTPHIDALARSGVRMTHGYATAPQCTPSRAGLITGRYQTRFDLENNDSGPLPLTEKTIADRLRQVGYRTGMVGKWHLNSMPQPHEHEKEAVDPEAWRQRQEEYLNNMTAGLYFPHARGFEEYYLEAGHGHLASHDLSGNPVTNSLVFDGRRHFRVKAHTLAALSFIDRHADEPFFLYIAYHSPHVPLQAPWKYVKRFGHVQNATRKKGLGMMAAVDDGVGFILEKLRELGIEEQTLVFFLSDNGAPNQRGWWNGSLNTPLVGAKGLLTDGGIRVPFLMSWKGVLPAGHVYDKPISTLDVVATSLARVGLPHDDSLDGVDLFPYVTGERSDAPHDFLYWRWRSQSAVRAGRWKLLKIGNQHTFLFDAESVSGETQNVADQYPEIVQELEARLTDWAAAQRPPGLDLVARENDLRHYNVDLLPRWMSQHDNTAEAAQGADKPATEPVSAE